MQFKNITLGLLLLATSSAIVSASNIPGSETGPSTAEGTKLPVTVEEIMKFFKDDGHFNKEEAIEKFIFSQEQISALNREGLVITRENICATLNIPAPFETPAKLPPTLVNVKEYFDSSTNLLKNADGLENFIELTPVQLQALKAEGFVLTEETLNAILNAPESNSAETHDETPTETPTETPVKLPATFGNIKECFDEDGHLNNSDGLNRILLSPAQLEALRAEDFVLNEGTLTAILNAPESNSVEAPAETRTETPAEVAAKLPANVQNIMKYVKHGKLVKADAVKNIDLTSAQLEALCVENLVVTEQVVKDILEPKVKETKKSAAVTETDELIVKDLFTLFQEGKINDLSQEMIKKHNLNAAQVKALKEATDLTEEKIKKILEANVEQNGSDVKSSSASANPEKSDDAKWYTSTWFIVLSSAAVLSALGSGVYMMTHKSDETDL